MENLLNRQGVQVSRCAINGRQECGVSGEYSLPDYCPDIAVILKCLVTPMIQNRHWSGEQLLIDGTALFRVLYLDEDRCRIHSVEFSHPFTCSMKTDGFIEMGMLSLELTVKYVNCRALSSRRLEARCGVCVHAFAECSDSYDVALPPQTEGLMSRCETVCLSAVVSAAEKILTVSETFDFPNDLSSAEMLLGGECRVDVKECKLLKGKAIVKGNVYIHQLYTDDFSKGTTHCLDFTLPYSQILDIDDCAEVLIANAHAVVLSDTERCIAGPDGENSVLEVTVKLLIQCQIHQNSQVELLTDAYHTQYPITVKKQEKSFSTYLGCGIHQSILPMLFDLPNTAIQELLDVWITPGESGVNVRDDVGLITGKLMISMIARDRDGQIAYYERTEEFQLEQPCSGNRVEASITIGEVRYRAIDGKIELQVNLNIALRAYHDGIYHVIEDMQIHKESPYPKQRAGVLMYYAQQGESVWDIGSHCHADAKNIRLENDLSTDIILRPTLLAVPLT